MNSLCKAQTTRVQRQYLRSYDTNDKPLCCWKYSTAFRDFPKKYRCSLSLSHTMWSLLSWFTCLKEAPDFYTKHVEGSTSSFTHCPICFHWGFSPGLTIIVHIPAKPKLQMQLRSTRYHETAALPKCGKWKISSGEICDLKWIMTAMHENL